MEELPLRVSLLETEIKLLNQKVEQNALMVQGVKRDLVDVIGELKKSVDHLCDEIVTMKIDRAKVEGGWWAGSKIAAFLAAIVGGLWAILTWITK